jgi:hypothetical protein
LQALLAKSVGGFHDGALVIAQLLAQQKGVIPLKSGLHLGLQK